METIFTAVILSFLLISMLVSDRLMRKDEKAHHTTFFDAADNHNIRSYI